MSEDWTDTEVELIVADYFAMLKDELAGIPINKTFHRRALLPLLNNRSEGSIEFKHQNISAVLNKLGVPWIVGYKPRSQYQHILETKTVAYLRKNLSLETYFREFAEGDVKKVSEAEVDFNNLLTEAPKPNKVAEEAPAYGGTARVNYLEIEQNNKMLGDKGEQLILQYEKVRLQNAGKESFADQIEWVAQTQGDWVGFDILSKNTNGTDRYIEVKTTKLGIDAPIFFSRNEYEFSQRKKDSYYLYRVFNFAASPKLFIHTGQFESFCRIEPYKFKGYF